MCQETPSYNVIAFNEWLLKLMFIHFWRIVLMLVPNRLQRFHLLPHSRHRGDIALNTIVRSECTYVRCVNEGDHITRCIVPVIRLTPIRCTSCTVFSSNTPEVCSTISCYFNCVNLKFV